MRKDTLVLEIRTIQDTDTAILELDDAVRESAAALDCGKVRPSASGLVRNTSGLVNMINSRMNPDLLEFLFFPH